MRLRTPLSGTRVTHLFVLLLLVINVDQITLHDGNIYSGRVRIELLMIVLDRKQRTVSGVAYTHPAGRLLLVSAARPAACLCSKTSKSIIMIQNNTRTHDNASKAMQSALLDPNKVQLLSSIRWWVAFYIPINHIGS